MNKTLAADENRLLANKVVSHASHACHTSQIRSYKCDVYIRCVHRILRGKGGGITGQVKENGVHSVMRNFAF